MWQGAHLCSVLQSIKKSLKKSYVKGFYKLQFQLSLVVGIAAESTKFMSRGCPTILQEKLYASNQAHMQTGSCLKSQKIFR